MIYIYIYIYIYSTVIQSAGAAGALFSHTPMYCAKSQCRTLGLSTAASYSPSPPWYVSL